MIITIVLLSSIGRVANKRSIRANKQVTLYSVSSSFHLYTLVGTYEIVLMVPILGVRARKEGLSVPPGQKDAASSCPKGKGARGTCSQPLAHPKLAEVDFFFLHGLHNAHLHAAAGANDPLS